MTSRMPFLLSECTVVADRYQVLRHLRSGSMGAIYEIFDKRTSARRALKMMLPGLVDANLRTRFEREARIAGQLGGDHIVQVFDVGLDVPTGLPYLVMELLHGEDLGAIVRNGGPLSPSVVIAYMTQIASALERLHAGGVVHRDLKPDNLFLTRRDDGSPCIKLIDFGVAKLYAINVAKATCVLGTPFYMAPEQISGDGPVTPLVDIYALGHVVYTLLVGQAYWADEKLPSVYQVFQRITSDLPESPCSRAMRTANVVLPAAFERWFVTATARDPFSRFQRASVAAQALASALGTAHEPTTPLFNSPAARSNSTSGAIASASAATYVSAERSIGTTIPGLRKVKPSAILIGSCVILLSSIALTSWSVGTVSTESTVQAIEIAATNAPSALVSVAPPLPQQAAASKPTPSTEVGQEKPGADSEQTKAQAVPVQHKAQAAPAQSNVVPKVNADVRQKAPQTKFIPPNPRPINEPMD